MSQWLDWKTERMPRPFERILVFVPGCGVYQGWSRGETATSAKAKAWNVAGFMRGDVTHWMPMPEPPTVGPGKEN